MVGNQHLDTQCMSQIHSRMRGNTVIDSDDQFCTTGSNLLDNFGTQPIAIFKTIWHQIINITATHATQSEHCQRRAGCAISIKITDNHNTTPVSQCLLQQSNTGFNTVELLPGKQAFYTALQLLGTFYATAGIKAAQQWV
ncbi:Uncharacterised protein [Yersinia enterocolitica]|nr:Uncharacterised protein [Yersinia enterocolitica]